MVAYSVGGEADASAALALAVREARDERGLSISALARESGVSRAMIAKIERAEVQPTAALLGRLSAALGMTLSELITRAETPARRLARAGEQPEWIDPQSGYSRRLLSPSGGGALELIEVTLPGGAEVAYPAGTYAFLHHQIWVISGSLRFFEGDVVHELESGDCLELGPPVECAYVNPTRRPCRYLVAVARKPRPSP